MPIRILQSHPTSILRIAAIQGVAVLLCGRPALDLQRRAGKFVELGNELGN